MLRIVPFLTFTPTCVEVVLESPNHLWEYQLQHVVGGFARSGHHEHWVGIRSTALPQALIVWWLVCGNWEGQVPSCLVPFLQEVHGELTKTWNALLLDRTHFARSFVLTTLVRLLWTHVRLQRGPEMGNQGMERLHTCLPQDRRLA